MDLRTVTGRTTLMRFEQHRYSYYLSNYINIGVKFTNHGRLLGRWMGLN